MPRQQAAPRRARTPPPRKRLAVLVPLLALTAGCARKPPADLPDSDPPPAAPAQPAATIAPTTVVGRLALADLAGLACDPAGRCIVQRGRRLIALDPDALAPDALAPDAPGVDDANAGALGDQVADLAEGERLVQADGPAVLGACTDGPGRCLRAVPGRGVPGESPSPERPVLDAAVDRSPAAQRDRWNDAIAHGGRSPFSARVPSPTGGTLAFLPHPEPRVMATGGGVRFMLLANGNGGADDDRRPAYLRTLALHPSGREAYLLAWPDGDLIAFDPARLSPRWTVPLRPAAHGLFVEGGGRLLVLEEGGQPDPDRLLDLGSAPPALPAGTAAGSDVFLALADRPDAATTAIVDLALPRLVWREEGRYLDLLTLPDGDRLLATDHALVRLSVPDGPVAAAPTSTAPASTAPASTASP